MQPVAVGWRGPSGRSCGHPPKQTSRAKGDHDDHRQEQDHIGEIGDQGRAKGVNGGGDDAAYKCAQQAADAPENYHDQRKRQHVRVESRVGGKDRTADDASRAGECGTGAFTNV